MEHKSDTPSFRRSARWQVLLVAALAVAAALPTLRGGFVGGDDYELVLNHVLVNHPSLDHACKLFTIVHHDLYQPLPMVSFSAQFAIAKGLGLFEDGRADSGAWLFHLVNLIMHAINVLLVRALIVRWRIGDHPSVLATLVACLFAVHPLQAEAVAWLNGQMMLMSTMFALASLLAFASWIEKPARLTAFLTILFVLLCAISKVRIGLPIVLLIMAPACGDSLRSVGRRFWILWGVCAAITTGFVLVNVWTTSQAQLFAGGAEYLHGPRTVRILLALGFYLQHIVWPAGLASWYPTPSVVSWTDGATLHGAGVVAVALVVMVWACRRWPAARLGVIWFVVTIVATLPIVPARSTLAADRYMYLPIIGLFIVVGTAVIAAHGRWLSPLVPVVRRAIVTVGSVAVLSSLLLTSWFTASFYETTMAKSQRVAQLFPDAPGVWSRMAWAHHRGGKQARDAGDQAGARHHFTEALSCADRELSTADEKGKGDCYQAIGLTRLEMGLIEEAVEPLERAVRADPSSPLAKFRLACVYDETGRPAAALALYEAAAQDSPAFNPALIRMAKKYRQLNRRQDARNAYACALLNNSYEVSAILGLAEMDIEAATVSSFTSAVGGLSALLDWMPEHTTARTNLGAALAGLARYDEAIRAYEEVVDSDRPEVTAILNLALLYDAVGETERAIELFGRATRMDMESIDRAVFVHDYYARRNLFDRCTVLWARFVQFHPGSHEAQSFGVWSTALAGDTRGADEQARKLCDSDGCQPLAMATIAYAALCERQYEEAVSWTARLGQSADYGSDAWRRFTGALGRFAERHPDEPWVDGLRAQLLVSEGMFDVADFSISSFEQACADDLCTQHARRLRAETTTGE